MKRLHTALLFAVGDLVRRTGTTTVGRVTKVYPVNDRVQVYWDQGVPWNYSMLSTRSIEHANR